MLLYTYYIISLRMLIHIVNYCIREKTQLLAHGRWFFPGTPASSTTKTCRHDISEILLKVAFLCFCI
jgi:hypothetical protein